MPKEDFQRLLAELSWCDWCYGIGEHVPVPDSLKNQYPIQEEFKSPIADFLDISAMEVDDNNVVV